MKIVVHHIGPTCVQCNQTKRVLDKAGLSYEQVDLREHPELTEKFKQLGHLTAPIVTVNDGQIWSGFKLERLRALELIEHADNKR
jgi:glutaredoxin-like protein NrdH